MQVPQQGQFPSCCLVVKGCQRCIFIVPCPGTFQSAELAQLEAEASANPGAKGQLLRHVHVGPDMPLVLLWHACMQTSLHATAT